VSRLVASAEVQHVWGGHRYGQPKAYVYFNIKQPNALFGTSTSARTSALARLYKMSLGDGINEYVYDAVVAGLGVSLEFAPKAIRLTFAGSFLPSLPPPVPPSPPSPPPSLPPSSPPSLPPEGWC
jgi:secreted Zn-dependent insulinase-like peptidase